MPSLKCVVCGKSVVENDPDAPITARRTAEGVEFFHVGCTSGLPAADGPWGTRYPAGSSTTG